MSIHWEMFSWEAFATIFTGIAAVAAAGWVGWNQVKIQRRQALFIENDLKIQLLEKRSALISNMREIHNAWIRALQLSDDEMQKFVKLVEQVQLLFPRNATEKLKEAVDATYSAEFALSLAYDFQQSDKPDEAREEFIKSNSKRKKVMELMPELLVILVNHARVDAWQ